jgi:hypothetical protein
MTIVSIDFSILYPGICICKDFTEFKWLSVVNSKITKKHRKNLEDLSLGYPNLRIAYTETERSKDPQYHITERIKLTNYLELTSLLSSELEKEVDKSDDLLVAIEGISFGSTGNVLVDISQATGILDGECDRFFVFSPSELKNAIGCKGNAPKGDIYDKFKEDPILESVKTSDLYRLISDEDWVIAKNGNVVSPIVDMIDSYLGVVKIHQILNLK